MAEQLTDPAGMTYADVGDLPKIRTFVAEQARALGLAATRIELLTLAVSELTTNTLQHTGGGGQIRIWADNLRLICDVVDSGGPRPLGRKMPPAGAIRGRGLAIVERICDSVHTMAVPGGTLVRICLNF